MTQTLRSYYLFTVSIFIFTLWHEINDIRVPKRKKNSGKDPPTYARKINNGSEPSLYIRVGDIPVWKIPNACISATNLKNTLIIKTTGILDTDNILLYYPYFFGPHLRWLKLSVVPLTESKFLPSSITWAIPLPLSHGWGINNLYHSLDAVAGPVEVANSLSQYVREHSLNEPDVLFIQDIDEDSRVSKFFFRGPSLFKQAFDTLKNFSTWKSLSRKGECYDNILLPFINVSLEDLTIDPVDSTWNPSKVPQGYLRSHRALPKVTWLPGTSSLAHSLTFSMRRVSQIRRIPGQNKYEAWKMNRNYSDCRAEYFEHPPRIGLIQRLNTRFILNHGEIVESLEKLGWKVSVLIFEKLSFEEQIVSVQNLSTLVGYHGAGLRWAEAMHPLGAEIQIQGFPCESNLKGAKSSMDFKHRYRVLPSLRNSLRDDETESLADKFCHNNTSTKIVQDVRRLNGIVDIQKLILTIKEIDPVLNSVPKQKKCS